jgi:Fe-S cluster assembly protein SufD
MRAVPSWLQSTRERAEAKFRSLPFPSAKDENFRFTPLRYQPEAGDALPGAALPEAIAALGTEEGALLLLERDSATLAGEAPGAFFAGLSSAAALEAEPVRALLGGEEFFPEDKFAQLTGARWESGAVLHVPAGVRLEKPVRFVACPRSAESHLRHLIVLEEGAEAVVIQESWSDSSERFVGELTEVRLGRNSRLHWVVIQQLGEGTQAVLRQKLELAEGAELRFSPLHVGGRLVQCRQEAHLAGENSFFETQGAARGGGGQHFDFWLDVRHEKPRSRSQMDYRFVMAGKAKGIFNGQVEVRQDAAGCESSQRSKTLLLGAGSVHAIPKLLIKTDDVKCSHGASVSSVSFEQLHYLQSRGIPKAEAERMIVRGFTELVVERFPTAGLRERAESLLDGKEGGAHE